MSIPSSNQTALQVGAAGHRANRSGSLALRGENHNGPTFVGTAFGK